MILRIKPTKNARIKMQMNAINRADRPEGSQENNRLNIANIGALLAEILQQAKHAHNANREVKDLTDHKRDC